MVLKVLFDIGHPAHVHLFKHVMWKIQEQGGEIYVTARDKDVATRLLDVYGFEYEIIGRYKSWMDKALSFITTTRKLLKTTKKFNPHVFVSVGSVHAPPVARLLNRLSLSFVDTEGSSFQRLLSRPFVSKVYTPDSFKVTLKKNHVRYHGHHEMAYLSPKYFTPDSSVLKKYGLTTDDTFFIVRLVAWQATHDWNQSGISDLERILKHLERYGKVLISSERGLDHQGTKIKPEDMHSILAYARIYVGEGATMASESAALGTPAIYVNTQKAGILKEQVEAELMYHILPPVNTEDDILEVIDEIMKIPREESRERSRNYILNRIDVVEYIMSEIRSAAESHYTSR